MRQLVWEPGRQAVFLDRDGVVNELVVRDGLAVSPRRVEDFRLRPGAAEAVARLRGCEMAVFVVSNQPDVARGHLAETELARMMDLLQSALLVTDVMVCLHDEADGCECRKPKPGMLISLAERWGVDLSRSFVVGDSWRDMEAGRRAGCRTILLDPGRTSYVPADTVVETLSEAVAEIALAVEEKS